MIASAAPLARAAFALAPGVVYLNHASTGVLPRRDARRAARHDRRPRRAGRPRRLAARGRAAGVPRAHRQFVGGRGEEIALLRNTGDGATVLAQGLDLGPGDEVIIGANEFGANAYPWLALRARGVTVTLLDAPRERMTPDALRAHALAAHAAGRGLVGRVRRRLPPRSRRAGRGRARRTARCSSSTRSRAWARSRSTSRATGVDAIYGGGPKWLLATQGIALPVAARRAARPRRAAPARLALGGRHLELPRLRPAARARRLALRGRHAQRPRRALARRPRWTSWPTRASSASRRTSSRSPTGSPKACRRAATRCSSDRSREDVKSGIVTSSARTLIRSRSAPPRRGRHLRHRAPRRHPRLTPRLQHARRDRRPARRPPGAEPVS